MPKESERKNLLEKTLSVAIAASMMDLLFEDDSSDDEIFDSMRCEDETSDEIDDDNDILGGFSRSEYTNISLDISFP